MLPNGNILFARMSGGGGIAPDKKIVRTYANHRDLRTVSSIQLLDVPGK